MASKKDPPPHDLTTQILVQIRDEIRETRSTFRKELGELRQEVGGLRQEVGELREGLGHLERRQREDATRLATELVAVAHAVGQVRDLIHA